MSAKLPAMHPEENKYEESKLITLIAGDSEYAFQVMYDRYRNRIYHTAVRYLKSPVLAQEVVQDVFLKLWLERKNLKPDQPVESWLYTVAKNNLLNRLKRIAIEWKAMHRFQLMAPKENSPTSGRLEDSQYNQILQRALSGLSEQQQKVFILARQEQLSYQEIAEILGISPLTVKTHMSRALQHIKSYLEAHGEIFFYILVLPSGFF